LIAIFASRPARVSAQQTYGLDNAHTSVIFSVSHFNIGYTYGRFNKNSGEFVIDESNSAKCKFTITIDVTSLDSNDAGRDKHLKTAEFFDVEKYPNIEFRSTDVKSEKKGTMKVTGKMNLHGVEKEITIPVTIVGKGKDPFGNERIGLLANFSIKRSDFGMNKMLEGVGDDVSITFSSEGILKK
jgi:polyisoprenoid-binding protein YceI